MNLFRGHLARLRAIRTIKKIGGAIGFDEGSRWGPLPSQKRVETIVFAELQGSPREIACLSDLSETRNLGIIDSNVGDEIVPHISSLKDLYQLNLFGSKLTDQGLQGLEQMASLKCLVVSNTRVSDEGVERFRSARPDCEVWCERFDEDLDI
jgi:hypothetical protein